MENTPSRTKSHPRAYNEKPRKDPLPEFILVAIAIDESRHAAKAVWHPFKECDGLNALACLAQLEESTFLGAAVATAMILASAFLALKIVISFIRRIFPHG